MGDVDETGHDQGPGEIAEQREAYVIIQRDGSILGDLDGPEIYFASESEAERWLLPGERIRQSLHLSEYRHGDTQSKPEEH